MKTRHLLILLILSILFGCFPDKRYSIKIVNNSSKDIMVLPGYDRFGANEYPDTTLPISKPTLIRVKKNDYNFIDASFEWKDIFNNLPSDTLSIFYFDADSVINLTWNRIQIKYVILKRDDLSLIDLESENWTQTFN
jgi:hypothetical protein